MSTLENISHQQGFGRSLYITISLLMALQLGVPTGASSQNVLDGTYTRDKNEGYDSNSKDEYLKKNLELNKTALEQYHKELEKIEKESEQDGDDDKKIKKTLSKMLYTTMNMEYTMYTITERMDNTSPYQVRNDAFFKKNMQEIEILANKRELKITDHMQLLFNAVHHIPNYEDLSGEEKIAFRKKKAAESDKRNAERDKRNASIEEKIALYEKTIQESEENIKQLDESLSNIDKAMEEYLLNMTKDFSPDQVKNNESRKKIVQEAQRVFKRTGGKVTPHMQLLFDAAQ